MYTHTNTHCTYPRTVQHAEEQQRGNTIAARFILYTNGITIKQSNKPPDFSLSFFNLSSLMTHMLSLSLSLSHTHTHTHTHTHSGLCATVCTCSSDEMCLYLLACRSSGTESKRSNYCIAGLVLRLLLLCLRPTVARL